MSESPRIIIIGNSEKVPNPWQIDTEGDKIADGGDPNPLVTDRRSERVRPCADRTGQKLPSLLVADSALCCRWLAGQVA